MRVSSLSSPLIPFAFLLVVLLILQLVDGLGSGSTLAVVYGTKTVCGVVAGEATQRVRCRRSGNNTVVAVPPDVSVQEISGGRSFFCGLRRGGLSLLCWDDKDFRPKRIYRSDDVALTDLSVGGDGRVCAREKITGAAMFWRQIGGIAVYVSEFRFSKITCGNGFVCGVLKNNSRILCWGNEIGDAIQSGFGEISMSSLIVAGESHVCGLTLAGALICRGENSSGQIKVPEGSEFEFSGGLALGANFSCAIRASDRTMACWGGGFSGRHVFEFEFESIVAGLDFVCGIKRTDYSVVCWGPKRYEDVIPIGKLVPGSELPVAVMLPPVFRSSSSSSKGISKIFFVVLIIGLVGLLIGVWSLVYCIRNRVFNKTDTMHNTETSSENETERYETFSFSELSSATGSFSNSNRIGSGSFGVVYRGSLPDGREVAIKRGHSRTKMSFHEKKEVAFESELAVLSRLEHENLVKLVGFCEESDERLLVYEYMPNGSLHSHLHGFGSELLGSWKMRIRIALEAARGIEYLHDVSDPPVIHRDIKSSNILLDSDMTARVSDFGLSLVGPESSDGGSFVAAGTPGYIDPEYYVLNVLTTKSDIYGLGVVMLELLTGKRAVFRSSTGVVTSVVEFYTAAEPGSVVLDHRLEKCTDGSSMARAVEILAAVADRCVSLEGHLRPDVAQVVACLETAFSLCP